MIVANVRPYAVMMADGGGGGGYSNPTAEIDTAATAAQADISTAGDSVGAGVYNGSVIDLNETQIDQVNEIFDRAVELLKAKAEDEVAWDNKKYSSVLGTDAKYAYLYPSPRYNMSRIESALDTLAAGKSEFNQIVEHIRDFATIDHSVLNSNGNITDDDNTKIVVDGKTDTKDQFKSTTDDEKKDGTETEDGVIGGATGTLPGEGGETGNGGQNNGESNGGAFNGHGTGGSYGDVTGGSNGNGNGGQFGSNGGSNGNGGGASSAAGSIAGILGGGAGGIGGAISGILGGGMGADGLLSGDYGDILGNSTGSILSGLNSGEFESSKGSISKGGKSSLSPSLDKFNKKDGEGSGLGTVGVIAAGGTVTLGAGAATIGGLHYYNNMKQMQLAKEKEEDDEEDEVEDEDEEKQEEMAHEESILDFKEHLLHLGLEDDDEIY